MAMQFVTAKSIAEAVSLSRNFGAGASLIAGGTDLVIQMRRKTRMPTHLIDIQSIEELKSIAIDDRSVTVGALVTHKEIERRFADDPVLPGLAESARIVGGHQVRNSGTIGGNICNASPAADLLPILLTLNAEVELIGESGARREPLDRFLVGPRQTTRAPDEVLTAVRFARLPSTATAFLKAGRRRAMEISIVSVAAALSVAPDGRCLEARIAVGAAAPTAFRAKAAEELLRDRVITEDLLRTVGEAAANASAPRTDVRASQDYRRRLVKVLVARALHACLARITP